ncbi:hypothetical protein BGW36DRAFT_78939 [Talaromyces proteolyticus]|uniref:Uncharacterized protein n=1 Tax=Talaromyces proteolyticus TaxID=1131652 RepID=A0AAD4KDL9_9EURO|nr:uncharacterized protein BGW36DRAFT_78939 [Talaromyces proteolyticus]KAH8689215.1 hypothetical protein BGW36DRAFT_78939 [Talaromyces proteolyticus]
MIGFKPEPLETSSRTSRTKKPTASDTSPTPHEPATNVPSWEFAVDDHIRQHNPTIQSAKTRRVLPQPEETFSRSSKKNRLRVDEDVNDRTASHHSHEIQTTEQSLPNTTSKQGSNEDRRAGKPMRRFHPEPIELMKRTRMRPVRGMPESSTAPRDAPRKFTPQLIETEKRSFRRAGSLHDDVSSSSDSSSYFTDRSQPSPLSEISDSPILAQEHTPSIPTESRFSYASLLQRQEGRQHSFRVPDLPAIPSNSSEDSDDSDLHSLSTSPSTSSQDGTRLSTRRNQSRESCDERFSSYLLSLAAQCAEKQFRDQALAAFPNEQIHQPVSHFAIDGDEDSDNEDGNVIAFPVHRSKRPIFRRESTTDLPWELEEMRRHKEEAESKDHGKQNNEERESRFSAAAIAARQPANHEQRPFLGGWQKDPDLAKMRHAASPPMLGYDIVFPMSTSPQGTTCEDDDGSNSIQDSGKTCHGKLTGLWTNDQYSGNEEGIGLWMGLCRKDEEPNMLNPSMMRPGIVTPRTDIDGESYLSLNHAANSSANTQLIGTPSDNKSSFDHIDKMLGLEKEIELELNDGFVSQVYNYLSLGYPSLARYYDHELSKISGVSIEDLRKDDLHTDPMGYVGVPDRSGAEKDKTSFDKCIRWSALRLYIQEWARQRPEMAGSNNSLDAWGVRERRGSWAI